MAKKFPDLTGDGKVTQADVLKGRGVEMKKGGSAKNWIKEASIVTGKQIGRAHV